MTKYTEWKRESYNGSCFGMYWEDYVDQDSEDKKQKFILYVKNRKNK